MRALCYGGFLAMWGSLTIVGTFWLWGSLSMKALRLAVVLWLWVGALWCLFGYF